MSHKIGVDENYWKRRSNMFYYKYIDILVKAFAYDAKSIIDIGSANTKYIESFYWIPEKYTLDIKNPYQSPNVKAIETDFLKYTPSKKFDFATCLQVLEHIPNAQEFARKLFEISDRVLISVPYMWPEGAENEHVNDPVDEKKLLNWTGREPSYSIIVAEPLRIPSKGISRRLICYYGPKDEKINYHKANENVRLLNNTEAFLTNDNIINNLFSGIQEIKDYSHSIQNKLNNISEIQNITQKKIRYLMEEHNKSKDFQKEVIEKQDKYLMLLKLEMENIQLKNKLELKRIENEKYNLKKLELKKQINNLKDKINKVKKQRKKYKKKINEITQSTSWKLTKPLRKIRLLLNGK